MPLNELNKFKSMLVRNLFRKGNRRNKCRKRRIRRKWFDGKGGDRIPKTKKKQYWK
jgi:hypothetical protein